MQISDNDILIHRDYKPLLRGTLVMSCFSLLSSLVMFLQQITTDTQLLVNVRRFPNISESIQQDVMLRRWFFLGIVIFLFCFYSLYLLFLIRKLRRPPLRLQINHEGFTFPSRVPFLVKWEEIRELSLTSFVGGPFLEIVLQDREHVMRRLRGSLGLFHRLGMDLGIALVGRNPLGITQMALPISLDDLVRAIQERFAHELRDHQIPIVGWQQ